MDIQIGRLMKAVKELGGTLLVTADHGNAEEMAEHDATGGTKHNADGSMKAKTSHTTNPVPLYLYDPSYNNEYNPELRSGLGLTSVAATVMNLLGYEAPADYEPSAIEMRQA